MLTVELDSKEYKDQKNKFGSPRKNEKPNNSTGIIRASKAGKSIIESDDTFSDKKTRTNNFELNEIGKD